GVSILFRFALIVVCVASAGTAVAEVLMAADGASFIDVDAVSAQVPVEGVVDRAPGREPSTDRGLAMIALGIALMMIAAPVNDLAKAVAERRLARGE
ncbi:MAG: hypothetical protein AAF698_05905, partial [Pseudomonadota bacterium]